MKLLKNCNKLKHINEIQLSFDFENNIENFCSIITLENRKYINPVIPYFAFSQEGAQFIKYNVVDYLLMQKEDIVTEIVSCSKINENKSTKIKLIEIVIARIDSLKDTLKVKILIKKHVIDDLFFDWLKGQIFDFLDRSDDLTEFPILRIVK